MDFSFTTTTEGVDYKQYHYEKFGYTITITRYKEENCRRKVYWKIYLDKCNFDYKEHLHDGILIDDKIKSIGEANRVFVEISLEEILDIIRNSEYRISRKKESDDSFINGLKKIKHAMNEAILQTEFMDKYCNLGFQILDDDHGRYVKHQVKLIDLNIGFLKKIIERKANEKKPN